ncbi:hypothetical protein HPB50_000338 [Hyalomma asiaticum]|uniref:Uncharacterized protein n=1 Tax=Hyalomma asiaticum TaxID=266040 RepID=A0ACB7T4D9_HYAAI|nr:hypothetical protein HPB50_000338 [Hyalomma asiaticum]
MPQPPRVVILRSVQRGVDWRPTQLVDQLPPALQACSLCGGVEPTTTALPCSHNFCDSCLRASAVRSEHGGFRCVLDDWICFAEEEVIRRTCSSQDAASVKVMCWNSCYGCEFKGPVSQLPDHFELECQFHPAVCPRCETTMLLADLPCHYQTVCTQSRERSEPTSQTSLFNRSSSTRRSSLREDVTLTAHDTLVGLETRMNELVEHVRNLDAKSTLMSSSISEVTEILRKSALTTATSGRCSCSPPDRVTVSSNLQGKKQRGAPNMNRRQSDPVSLAFNPHTSADHGPLSEVHETVIAQTVSLARQPLRRQTTQLTHYMPEAKGGDRDSRVFLVVFRRTKTATSGSASDFLPLYDLLKRGIELSIPETWTSKVVFDEDCFVKIVILEENSALDVYAKIEERRKTFNPWKVESAKVIHPNDSAILLSSGGSRLFEPIWTHSRAARLKFQASGYGFYGSNRLEAMCRRGFVVGNDSVTFCVTLIRKWNASQESTETEEEYTALPVATSET